MLDLAELPVGVFDSGVGGLTVLSALREQLPGESFLYLGDTARLPYGTKSSHTVTRYAMQAAGVLVERGIKLLVVACNTVSAVALERLRDHFAPLPVVGVVEPGASAACVRSQTGAILVIGTESTIRGGAYERAIASRREHARVTSQACSLFVALAEEGWIAGDVVDAIATRYLAAHFRREISHVPDCVVLGCTHFPVLRGAITRVVGPEVVLVDSAATTATAVTQALSQGGLLARNDHPITKLLATDAPDRFARVGEVFLRTAIPQGSVELVDLTPM